MFGIGQFKLQDLGVAVVRDDFGELQVNEALIATGEGLCCGNGSFCSRLGSIGSDLLVASQE